MPPKCASSLLQVSHQISDEVLDILYGSNIFKIVLHGDHQNTLEHVFCAGNGRRIRHIMLVLRPDRILYLHGLRIDAALGDIILPHLRNLWIVAEQPRVENHRWKCLQTPEQELKEWL